MSNVFNARVATATLFCLLSAASVRSFASEVIWSDDAVPDGAAQLADGGDAWNWIASNPSPVSGALAHQSSLSAGLHEHLFNYAGTPLSVAAGEVLFAYVYVDPANPPSEIMLSWNSDGWEHRAYWGGNTINYGTDGTAGRHYVGPVPAAGQWIRLEVPASQVGLEGAALTGMGFSLFDGRVTWDKAGKASQATVAAPPTVAPSVNEVIWSDDAVPDGAAQLADGGDAWNWIASNPSPASGALAHQSSLSAGLHEHLFNYAGTPFSVAAGEALFAYVYLDPANPPSELMLSWNANDWEHRAYWGGNAINYGTDGTAGRHYVGPMPAAGQWVRLEVPASQVGLEGAALTGMGFSLFDGRATWDKAGKTSQATVTPPANDGSPLSPVAVSNPSSTPLLPGDVTAALARGYNVDDTALQLANPGDSLLHILSPTLLELKLIDTKQPGSGPLASWNFVNGSGQMTAPAATKFVVDVAGYSVSVQSVGFKRRVLYAPLQHYDLRVENSLYLRLSSPIADGQLVQVTNPDGSLWPDSTLFRAICAAQRYSPAIHVNQEGYVPSLPKKAMIGYYLGDMGEMAIAASSGFAIVEVRSGAAVYHGSLTPRADVGYPTTPAPYQKVLMADFSDFVTPGEYELEVPGLGASLPFLIDEGIAMGFTRTYALGLYHQRSGTSNDLPFTRFVHAADHTAPAQIPVQSDPQFAFTWATIASYGSVQGADNPAQTAPRLTSEASQLYPFVRQGSVDVSGGHFDAGDYSKYTINSAELVHYLVFTVDSIPGAAALDNLGIPESGDGISDILQEAKWEADYLSKLQDSDGGFYFLTYPKNHEYESNVQPDHGESQVVWPKNTAVTAAAVAALAQCASSPQFKQHYPEAAAKFLKQAQLGWQFLTKAIAKYGKAGAYQKITFYGDRFTHDDELAWAACEMFLATGEAQYQQQLFAWFPDPSDPATFHWGWVRMSESWGNAIRSYAFAARSGRLPASALDAGYLAKCEGQIVAAGDDVLDWSAKNAYATPFPLATKAVNGAGWYFSLDQASDMAVAYQVEPKPAYIDALVGAMNYEAGTNPVNVTFLTGLGLKRQREIVSQYAQSDRRVLPPSGIPLGNIQASFQHMPNYGLELREATYPDDNAVSGPYPFYDRWSDAFNVTTEFITVNQARSLLATAFLASRTTAAKRRWVPVRAEIVAPKTTTQLNAPVTLRLAVPGENLAGARIVWEARDQEPAFGPTYTISPKNNGAQWVEAEAEWPDGRRSFAAGTFMANSAVVAWLAGALPADATPTSSGGDGWNWIVADPVPPSGVRAHRSNLAAGLHEHGFTGASATLAIGRGDVLFAWVCLDPKNPPTEIMLAWNDGSSWEHRAYWGANTITYGRSGSAGRYPVGPLPPAGRWIRLSVPARAIGLEGAAVNGMDFSQVNGRATWDTAGRSDAEASR